MRNKWLISFVSIITLLLFTGCTSFTESGSNSNEGIDIESYPEREIDLIIPYASGGSADLQARIVADSLKDELDQNINVIAKGGGAGSTGMNFVKGAKADGLTIILTAVGPSTLTPNSDNVGYEVTEDFAPISQITEAPYGIAVNSSSDIDTLEELFEKAKEEDLTYGTTGTGLHQHVVTAALLSEIDDVTMEHVPFDGGAEAVSALLGNHITATVNTISELLPHAESGDLKILAVTSEERLNEIDDVPTFKELNYDLISNGAWFGFMAPKETPEEIINKLDESIKNALENDEVIDKFKNAELPIEYLNHQDFTEKVTEENKNNAQVIKDLDL